MFNSRFYTQNSFSQSMTLLIKMQKTLVTFSLTIMFKVSVLFTFSRRWINSNLIWQEYEKKWKVQHVGFRKCSFNIYNRILLVQHVCIIDGTNLINSLPCKPTLNLLFLIVWLGSSCCYPFFKFFFSSLSMCSRYSTCSKFSGMGCFPDTCFLMTDAKIK